MPPQRTTTSTANSCWDATVSSLGKDAAMDVRGHCGMPMNNATKQAGGTEAYVACFRDAMKGADGDPYAAARAAAQKCSQPQ